MSESLVLNTPIPISASMHYEWIEEGRVIVYYIGTHERDEVNVLMDFILQHMREWERDKPYLAIYEAKDTRIIFTQHARVRLNEISASEPDLKGRSAGVVPFPVLNHALRLFTTLKARENRAKRVFTNRADAVKWLLEYRDGDKL